MNILPRLRRFLGYPKVLSYNGPEPLPKLENAVSQICTQSQFDCGVYRFWCDQIKEPPRYHRKQWEYVYILQVLKQHEKLLPGYKGIGFGIGKEPIPAVLAKFGCKILASDLPSNSPVVKQWSATYQHAETLEALNERGICYPVTFQKNVSLASIDMNNVDYTFRKEAYDFLWSSNSLDHLGSIRKGIDFIINTIDCLKPGGIAVHTTEYNVSSASATIDNDPTVIFRRKDVENIIKLAAQRGCRMEVNWNHGSDALDRYYDIPPYSGDNHLKLLLKNFVITSIGLTICKAE